MKYSLFIFSLLLSLLSCSNSKNKQTPADYQYKKVMEVHDSIMPEMATIHRLKRQLKEYNHKKEVKSLEVYDLIKKLDEADDAMMNWMHDLQIPEEENLKYQYLLDQFPLIEDVRDKMLDAINQSQIYLQKNDPGTHEN